MSYVPRKPVPLGCEVKCVADGTSGVMMYIELQEGREDQNDASSIF
jgi:hypothetical protein